MSTADQRETGAHLNVENIGGIATTSVTVPPGVTALVGENATNRTSLLKALMAACGTEQIPLKGDADEGRVELTLDGTTYNRQLRRHQGGVHAEGDPYLDDPTVADLFAFLLEPNQARRAVERGDDLRELIMRPVDTDAIHAEIDRLESERRRIDEQLDELDDIRGRLPELEQRRRQLGEQIEGKTEELEAKKAELDQADADLDETRTEKADLDAKLEELSSVRTTLEDTRSTLETERESLANLRDERATVETELNDLTDVPLGEIQELDTELEQLRERKQTIETAMNQLQRVIQFNETMLDGENDEMLEAVQDIVDEDTTITDQLLDQSAVVCWTCGTEVDRDDIETTLDSLRDIRKAKLNEVNDIDSRIDEIQDEKQELEDHQRQRDRLERRLSNLDAEIDETEETIERLETRREGLTDEIEQLENEIEALESETYSELLELHKEVNQLEFEREQLEEEREEIESEIAEREARLEKEDDLRAQRDAIQEELVDQRTRIEQLEADVVEEFNTQMEELLDLLHFTNLERIWLERREAEPRERQQGITSTVFDLHVVRATADGATYEDTVAHLSESEREVTGLVFALAGYLAHDVYETLPFLLLDSLEAIDSSRIGTLIDYVSDYAEYVVVALLPQDATALDEDYCRITDI